ncbi:MAG: FAD:protein FMN transferase [Bryobacterales bacterium]|nr:FAD:protein FMN transferase [Bryobacterales bacterium]
MGTAYSLVLYGEDRAVLENAAEESFEETRRLDRLLSNYRPKSEWSTVNREAAGQPVPVSQELFDLLAACEEYSRLSGGAFDISVGPLIKVWGFYKGSGRLPHRAEVRTALSSVGYEGMVLDRKERTVRFAKSGMEIDPGGIGKGYAVDRVVEILRRHGVPAALVSAGGSSIYAMGAPPGQDGWKINILHPLDESKTVAPLVLRDESMSTSGSYQKFFRAEGRIFSHIMDPRTGYPAEGMLSVSVVAPRTIDSEAWTKPVFIRGRQWAAENLPKGFRAIVCPDPGSGRGRKRGIGMDVTCEWLR